MIIDNAFIWRLAWRTSLKLSVYKSNFDMISAALFLKIWVFLFSQISCTNSKQAIKCLPVLNFKYIVQTASHVNQRECNWNDFLFVKYEILGFKWTIIETWNHIQCGTHLTCTFIFLWLCLFQSNVVYGFVVSAYDMRSCLAARVWERNALNAVWSWAGLSILKISSLTELMRATNQITRNQNVWGCNGCHPVHIICSVCLCA